MSVKSLFFTREALNNIKIPTEKQNIYRDTKEKGLFLIVSYGGSKTFYLGKKIQQLYQKIKIGRFPELSITEARTRASELKGEIAKGYNPAEERARLLKELTFKDFYDKYLNEYSKINNKRWKDYAASVDRYAKHLYPRKISTIQKIDIQELFNNLTKTGKYGANRFLEILSPVFSKAIEWGLIKVNPVIGIKKHQEQSRDRYLTREEIPQFFTAIAEEKNQVMKDFFLIALYTSVRKDNLLTMKWEQVSFTDKQLYLPETKNGDPHRLPLLDQAVEILKARKEQSDSIWVFPSESSSSGHLQEPKKAWKRICKKAGIENLRIHDLRRTIPSWMAMTGANQYVIGQLLNHRDPRSTAIYTRLATDTAREYMQKAINEMISTVKQ